MLLYVVLSSSSRFELDVVKQIETNGRARLPRARRGTAILAVGPMGILPVGSR